MSNRCRCLKRAYVASISGHRAFGWNFGRVPVLVEVSPEVVGHLASDGDLVVRDTPLECARQMERIEASKEAKSSTRTVTEELDRATHIVRGWPNWMLRVLGKGE